MFDSMVLWLLVACLGSPSWHTRELAHRALQSRPDAVPMLRACQGCKSPEIAGRATQILSGHYRANAERLTAGMTFFPWCDGLQWDHPERELLMSYLNKARVKVGSCAAPDYFDYRYATRLWVLDQYRQGASPESVRDMLEVLQKREVDWTYQNGDRYGVALPLRRE